tara:strand:+ start:137 stop:1042 length:906 start_codon:yes stop_codon:yes gene_type:complete
MKLLFENWRNFVDSIGEAAEPTPFKSAAQKRYKAQRKRNDMYSSPPGHKNLSSGSPFETKPKRAGTDRLRFEEETELENWRKFVNEEVEEPITTLRIFDFDETIAHTRSETRVKAPDGTELTVRSQQEFEEYMRAAAAKEGIEAFDAVDALIGLGYQIDMSDFSIVKDPHEISVITDIMREFPPNSKTYVVTARQGASLGPIMDYLDELGIDSSQVRPIATQGESKGDVMVVMMKNKIMDNGKSNINRIEYYEDSQKNIDDVLRKVCEDPELDDIKPLDFELIINKVINNDGQYNIQEIEC